MKTIFRCSTQIINTLLMLFFIFSCTTMPQITEEELALQGKEMSSINEIINLIDTGAIKPQKIEITEELPDYPFYQYFNLENSYHISIDEEYLWVGIKRIRFSDVKLGKENSGFLRKEDPMITFPIMGDSVETDSFTTVFDIWQFEGNGGQSIDLMVRSISTFPVGNFVPYFLLLKDDGTIIGRQTNILHTDKEAIKGTSMMVWIEDFILPETGKYYLIVLAENNKEKDNRRWNMTVRLDKDRMPLGTAYKNQGWIFWDGMDSRIEMEGQQISNLYLESRIFFIDKQDLPQGKYHVILWKNN